LIVPSAYTGTINLVSSSDTAGVLMGTCSPCGVMQAAVIQKKNNDDG